MSWQTHPVNKGTRTVQDYKIVAYGEGGQTIEIEALCDLATVRQLQHMLETDGWTVRVYRRSYADMEDDDT